jgi:hypothetical protein
MNHLGSFTRTKESGFVLIYEHTLEKQYGETFKQAGGA